MWKVVNQIFAQAGLLSGKKAEIAVEPKVSKPTLEKQLAVLALAADVPYDEYEDICKKLEGWVDKATANQDLPDHSNADES